MRILKINEKKANAHSSIKKSMTDKKEISIRNGLDACGCTGNGQC